MTVFNDTHNFAVVYVLYNQLYVWVILNQKPGSILITQVLAVNYFWNTSRRNKYLDDLNLYWMFLLDYHTFNKNKVKDYVKFVSEGWVFLSMILYYSAISA